MAYGTNPSPRGVSSIQNVDTSQYVWWYKIESKVVPLLTILLRRSGILVHTFKEPLQILGVNARRDTMTQIRDPCTRLALDAELLAHALHLALDRISSAIQQPRVEVALQRDLPADERARDGAVDAPVESEDVVPGARELGEVVVRALGEERHRHGREAFGGEGRTHARGDACERWEGELGEVVGCELAGPGVEYLQQLR